MESGQIFNATLECPDSPYLDYGLLLCKVAENGDLTPISECNLGTYIDPQTNKTVEEKPPLNCLQFSGVRFTRGFRSFITKHQRKTMPSL
jgi:hypothetical protein